MLGISPKLPLQLSSSDGPYRLTKTIKEAISQNLKMLILTNPGERMMDPNFGAGLRRYLFQNFSPTIYDKITSRIDEQVRIYLPQVNIQKVIFNESQDDQAISDMMDNNILSVTIRYSIGSFPGSEILTIPIVQWLLIIF